MEWQQSPMKRLPDVSAAIEYGMRGIIFSNYRDLVETLRREELLR
jgi:hypothetical protein